MLNAAWSDCFPGVHSRVGFRRRGQSSSHSSSSHPPPLPPSRRNAGTGGRRKRSSPERTGFRGDPGFAVSNALLYSRRDSEAQSIEPFIRIVAHRRSARWVSSCKASKPRVRESLTNSLQRIGTLAAIPCCKRQALGGKRGRYSENCPNPGVTSTLQLENSAGRSSSATLSLAPSPSRFPARIGSGDWA